MKNNKIAAVYAINQSLGLSLGWFFHSVISHLWTGEHEYTLTTSQLLMHNVSLSGCAFIFLFFQNRAVNQLFGFSIMRYWLLYWLVPILLFWVGFYLEAVPLDVLLWFLSVGILNGLIMRRHLKLTSNQWVLRSALSAVIGFLVAVVILIPLDGYLTSLKCLMAHVVMFTLLGVVGGIPMALIGGRWLAKLVP